MVMMNLSETHHYDDPMTGSLKLYSDDVIIAEDHKRMSSLVVNMEHVKLNSIKEISEFFELDKCLAWIRKNCFMKVALQFPDDYLRYSFELAAFLESVSSTKFYILGDTSYGSCCVDYVTAEHAACDALIHFGVACMSAAVERLPLFYVFGRQHLDLAKFDLELRKNAFLATEKTNIDMETQKVALLVDTEYSYLEEQLHQIVNDVYPGAKIFLIQKDFNGLDSLNSDTSALYVSTLVEQELVLGRIVPSCVRFWTHATLLFIGLESSPLLSIWLMSFSQQFNTILHFIPASDKIIVKRPPIIRYLRKRFYLMESLRDAQRVGLVIGTLSIKDFREAVNRVRNLCSVAGKHLYVFSIGKINEAKLSNFADHIDAFILLSCPFGIILNTNEFYKPIVSLYEAEMALNPSKDWFASNELWTAEFHQFINDFIGKSPKNDQADVSLITGRIRAINLLENGNPEKQMQLIQYSAGNYFTTRSWKGLNDETIIGTDQKSQDEICVQPGLDGLAVDYKSEYES